MRRFQCLDTCNRQVLRMERLSLPHCGTGDREKTKTSDKASDQREVKVASTPIDYCRAQDQKLNTTRTRPPRQSLFPLRELPCHPSFALNRGLCFCESACGRNRHYALSPVGQKQLEIIRRGPNGHDADPKR